MLVTAFTTQEGLMTILEPVARPTRSAPPTWDAERCAAGIAGIPGCQRCAEACPYDALRIKARPAGLAIEIDPDACRRCGACTGACPTDALTRSFATDAEVDAAVARAVEAAEAGTTLVLTCPDSAVRLDDPLPGAAVVTLPSLLLLDETHLLGALRAGAQAVAVIACEDCHHDAPAPLLEAIAMARAAAGHERIALLADDDGHGPERLADLLGATATPAPLAPAATDGTRRRQRLLDLLDDDLTLDTAALADLPTGPVPLGGVMVDDDACTMCGACARLCPTEALAYEPALGTLTFDASACVGCGLCAAGCPQEAVALTSPPLERDLAAGRRTLVEDGVVACRHCDAPFTPQRLLDHAWHTLTDQSGPAQAARASLDVCGDCKDRGGPAVPEGARTPGGATDQPDAAGGDGVSRRGFLKTAAATVAGASLLPLAGRGAPAAAQETGRAHWAMVIDLERCIGCHACTNVCKAENNVPIGGFRDWVEEHEMGEYPNSRAEFLPKLCNQCDDPGCLRVCPTGSIYRREGDNIIELDPDICIACQACMQGCPYGMTFYNSARRTADKCNYCAHRLDAGMRPACVDICPSQCRIFGDLNDPDSWVSQALADRESIGIREELGMGPNTTYFALPGHLNA